MTPDDFTTWLKGVSDILGDEPPSAERWARIKEQLTRVSAAQPAPARPPSYPVPAKPDLTYPRYDSPTVQPREWWTPIVTCGEGKLNGSS